MGKSAILLFSALAALATAAVAQPPAASGPTGPASPATVRTSADAAAVLKYQYRLDAGDKLQITTFGEPSLTGPFEVSGNGTVAVPLVGEIPAKGRTPLEFSAAVEAALRNGYLRNPNVSVEVLTYRPFYILGEVQKPGEYPYINGLTVLNAVATANGFTYRANTHHVLIKRADENAEHDVVLSADTPVEPGDTIRVKERYF